jgi:hypothetical protein
MIYLPNLAPQALEHVLEGPTADAALSALLVCLPQHAVAILNHFKLDASCQTCSRKENRNSDASTAYAVLQALNSMAAAASYRQLQELLLCLLQLAACGEQCRETEGAALAVSSMCYYATMLNPRNRW